MSNFKVIAVEQPFMLSFLPYTPVNACVLKDDDIFISFKGELSRIDSYKGYIDIVNHAVKEGKYEWTDFNITETDIIQRDFDNNILANEVIINPFTPFDNTSNSEMSQSTLQLFNDFLRYCNRDKKEMVEALRLSYKDGFFRKEVKEIIKDDTLDELLNMDREIIVRCKAEGTDYITKYVKELLSSKALDKYIDINYFFRRVFVLEKYNYLKF